MVVLSFDTLLDEVVQTSTKRALVRHRVERPGGVPGGAVLNSTWSGKRNIVRVRRRLTRRLVRRRGTVVAL
jgi:hypothetical protein